MSDCCGAIDAAKLEQRQRRVLQQVLAINLVGEGLNDALNPRLRERTS